MLYGLTFVVFFLLAASVHAVREQHVVVLRWPVGFFFLIRGPDGQYTLFHGARFPLVVSRHAVACLAGALGAAGRRVRGWTTQRPVALGIRH